MADNPNPLVGFHFSVDLQGGAKGYFTEVSGIGSENEVTDHKVITEKGQEVVMKVPGRLKWGDITLKRGITSNLDMWKWRKQVEDGDVEGARKDGSIIMYDAQLKVAARWDFKRAWPSKVTGPSPKSDTGEIGIEEMTIVHEYIKREQ